MTKYFWKSAVSGDWAATIDWSPVGLPNAATDDVLINLPGNYAVSIASTDPGYLADSVTLDDGSGTLAIGSTLTLGGTSHLLAIQAGQVVLGNGATLKGATVSETGGLLMFGGSGATLSGDSIIGGLALDAQTVDVIGGLAVTAAGGGPGTIDASGSSLDVLDSETLNNAVILLSNGGIEAGGTTGQTLTLGPQVSVVEDYGSASFTGQEILNQGVITLSNGSFTNNALDLTNAAGGTISLLDGESFGEYASDTLVNAGLIQVGQGASAVLNGGGDTVSNTGSITVAAGGTLDIAAPASGSLGAISNAGTVDVTGTYTLAALAGVTGSGLLELGGTLNLGGGTLNVQAGTTLANLLINGVVNNGTIETTSGTASLAGATLEDVTYLGTLQSTNLSVEGGLTVETAAGGQPGTINLTNADLTVLDSETLDNVSILLNSGGLSADATLTLGQQATLTQTGGNSSIYATVSGAAFVNKGSLSLSGGSVNDQAASFTNAATGTISLSGGEDFYAQYGSGYTLANAGLIQIASGATLYANGVFTNTGSISVTGGTLNLSPASSVSLGTISNAGTVELGGTYSLASLAGVSGSGLLQLGSTLNLGGGTLDIQAGTSLSNVALTGVLENGTIEVTSGSLSLAGATLDGVTYLGSLVVPTNATVAIEDGLTVETASGGVPGTIDLTASYATLNVLDSETLSNLSLLLGRGTIYAEQSLTLGASVVATQTSGAFTFSDSNDSHTLTNDGTLTLGGGTAADEVNSFVNAGQLSLLAGEDFSSPNFGKSFTNVAGGTISIASGTTLDLSAVTLANAGSISLQAGGTLIVGAATSLANLGSISGAGTVEIVGTASLGTSTLTLNSASGIGNLLVASNAELLSGTVIENSGSLLLASGATLDAVTVWGSLIEGSSGTITGGLTVKNQAGTAPGTIDLATNSTSLTVTDSETLDNATLLIGNGSDIEQGAATSLTLGTGAVLLQTRGIASFGYYSLPNATIDNKGLIQLSNGTLTDYVQSLINDGTLALLSNESFVVEANSSGTTNVTNTKLLQIGQLSTFALSTGSFTNTGTVQVQAGGDLKVGAAASISQKGTIQVAATGTVEVASSTTLSALGTITGTGTLTVDAGTTLDLGGGTLDLGGNDGFDTLVLTGAITDGTLEYDADNQGGLVLNGGTIASTITVSGTNAIGTATTLTGDTNLAGGTLDIAIGSTHSDVLLQNGDLRGGTVKLDGGVFTLGSGATLDGITLVGGLVIPTSNSTVDVKDGLSVLNSDGSSPGTLALFASLTFLDTETLSNVSVLLGDNASINENATNGTLTLGATTTLTHSTTGSVQLYGSGVTSAIANAGTIAITSGVADVEPANFINSGTVTVGPNALLDAYYTLTNTGTISIANAGTLSVGNESNTGSDFANTGSINIAAGGTLQLYGTITPATLAGITNNGTLEIEGTLNLGGGTLDVKPGTAFANVINYGTIENGTIKPDGGTLTTTGATLDAVTVLGPLVLGSGQTSILGGLTVETASGGQPGIIQYASSNSTLYVADTETLSNVNILVGSSTNSYLDAGSTTTLTLASTTTLTAGPGAALNLGGGEIINDGLIALATSGLDDNGTSFVNAGTLSVTGSATEQFYSTGSFSNSGHVAIGSGSNLLLSTGFTNTGTIAVAAGGTLSAGGTVGLASFGTVQVAQGGTLDITGTLDLGGGTLDLASGSTFGNVLLSGDLKNGTVKFDGGTLAMNGGTLTGVTTVGSLALGSGSVTVTGGLTVETAAAGTPGTVAIGNGSLYVADSETLSNMSISIGSSGGAGTLYALAPSLTLASSTTLVSVAGSVRLEGSTFINDGLILAGNPLNHPLISREQFYG